MGSSLEKLPASVCRNHGARRLARNVNVYSNALGRDLSLSLSRHATGHNGCVLRARATRCFIILATFNTGRDINEHLDFEHLRDN